MRLEGKVFITGGAGFLGRGLLRRAFLEGWPCKFTVYSRDENKHELLRRAYPGIHCILGDVRDYDRLEAAVAGHDVVIHAAALKYIPEAELNPTECLEVNVRGSQNIIKAARRQGVEVVIGISTDKACQPVNIYGASKFAMERLFSEYISRGSTRFCCVRYGNVVGSTGSVIPLFQRQLKEEGVVKVTDTRMTRFWLSIDDAVNLIILAFEQGAPGAVLLPMAKAMRVYELAQVVAGEAPIEVVGIRPGEKLHERLLSYEESVRVVDNRGYFSLLSPDSKVGGEPFTISSESPHQWIERDEMAAMIADSERV